MEDMKTCMNLRTTQQVQIQNISGSKCKKHGMCLGSFDPIWSDLIPLVLVFASQEQTQVWRSLGVLQYVSQAQFLDEFVCWVCLKLSEESENPGKNMAYHSIMFPSFSHWNCYKSGGWLIIFPKVLVHIAHTDLAGIWSDAFCPMVYRVAVSIAMGYPHRNGWFLLGKIPSKWMMTGVPLFQETPQGEKQHTFPPCSGPTWKGISQFCRAGLPKSQVGVQLK